MTTTHSFAESLAASRRVEELPFWEDVYRRAWDDVDVVRRHRANGEHQRAGIDTSILLKSSRQILIDEKFRRKDYGDILIERWSSFDREGNRGVSPGWIVKPLRIDFIAYAILPAGRLYLLPFAPLQAAWRRYGREWMKGRAIDAENEENGQTWVTRSWAVRPDVLFAAMTEEYGFAPVALDA